MLVIRRRASDFAHLRARTVQPALVAVNEGLLVLEHGDVVVELVANLHAQLALPRNGRAQPVELLVLVGEDLAVVGVNLLVVVELGRLVAVALGRVRVVAVGAVEERCGRGVGIGVGVGVGVGIGVLGGRGR